MMRRRIFLLPGICFLLLISVVYANAAPAQPTSGGLTASLPSPQPEGTVIPFTASAQGGSGTYEYRFWERGPFTDNQWQMVRDYSTIPSISWESFGKIGTNHVHVHIRSVGTTDGSYLPVDHVFEITASPPFHTLEGGSGGAADAGFSLKGTMGQGIAGVSSSGNYIMQAGFQYIMNSFAYYDSDGDGMVDRWELDYFGVLVDAGADPDGDELTNLEEFTLGLDPTVGVSDTDADKLLDRWELDNFGSLDFDRADDPDGDGIINYLEHKLKSNPMSETDRPDPGNYYEYDGLGRIKKIIRIPAQ